MRSGSGAEVLWSKPTKAGGFDSEHAHAHALLLQTAPSLAVQSLGLRRDSTGPTGPADLTPGAESFTTASAGSIRPHGDNVHRTDSNLSPSSLMCRPSMTCRFLTVDVLTVNT